MQFTNKSVGPLWWSRHFEVGSDKERAREEARVSLSRAPFFLAPTNSKRLLRRLNKTWSPNRNKLNMAESMMVDFIAKRIHHRTSYAW